VTREPKVTIVGENNSRRSMIHGDMGTSQYTPLIIDKRVQENNRAQDRKNHAMYHSQSVGRPVATTFGDFKKDM